MLRVGLSGGIGSGKSTAAAVLRSLGAVVVDADVVAREVVAPGTPGLAAVLERFGDGVRAPDGGLDRAALGRVVFADAGARRDLEDITHPLIGRRTEELFEAAPDDAVVVHDMPLLVEKEMSAEYHLVLLVGASERTRLRRLVEHRGMGEDDARARMVAQADDDARRAAADAWLENEGTPAALEDAVRRVWHARVEPFAENLRAGAAGGSGSPVLGPPDPGWAAAAARLLARVRLTVGAVAGSLDHVGATAVPGLPARDVVDLQVGVHRLADADDPAVVTALAAAGFPRLEGSGPPGGAERTHGSCDPGRVARLHVREVGSPGWSDALLLRDWLRAEPVERDGYARLEAGLAARRPGPTNDAADRRAWVADALPRARGWAARSGWAPPS
ncbi:dephospho-CoA kinase [Phycicoccus flavus]|uniref:Dephospho-CoA kinase n=1 Tax=Phycicoccus flavus TaxID=2502783 RepID=A0A8T6R0B2_9MICO|nr:dephospho-CoA kinase [Phycicoccus flavus]NHA67276.1 dephospho-CoA kinase [Phycicoccus flavus]